MCEPGAAKVTVRDRMHAVQTSAECLDKARAVADKIEAGSVDADALQIRAYLDLAIEWRLLAQLI